MVASERTKWYALALICAVQFMVVLDIAIVNVALPSIQVDLGFSQGDLQWVISAYALVFGGFMLLGGRLADILGRRGVFMGGLVIFTIGSLLCGFAWSDESLIVARAHPGSRRRDHHSRSALHPDHHLHRGTRAQHRARRLGRGRRLRRRRGRAPGRDPHRPPVLGVDLLGQHPGRHRRARALADPALREPGRARAEPRRPRRGAGDVRPRPARPRDHAGLQLGLGLRDDDRRIRRLGRAARRASSSGSNGRRSRSSRSRSSASRRSPGRTSPASSWARRCSRCS